MRRGRRAAFAAVCLLMVLSAQGRVYQSLGDRRGGRLDGDASGWRLGYESELVVDGEKVDVDVFSSPLIMAATAAQLRRQFEARGGEVTASGQGQLGWVRARWDDREIRALLLAPGTGPGTILFLLYASDRGGERRPERPRAVPVPGGATPLRSLRNLSTGTELYLYRLAAAPETIERFYVDHLVRDGWRPMPPPGRLQAPVSGAFYLKGRMIFCLSVQTGGATDENILTLLLRELPR